METPEKILKFKDLVTQKTAKDTSKYVHYYNDIGKELGLTEKESLNIARFLSKTGQIDMPIMAGNLRIK